MDDLDELKNLVQEASREVNAKLDRVLAEMPIIRHSLDIIEANQDLERFDRVISALEGLDRVLGDMPNDVVVLGPDRQKIDRAIAALKGAKPS